MIATKPLFLLAATLLIANGCASTSTPAGDGPILSAATTMDEAGMADIRTLVPDMSQDIRYFGSNNFVGAPVDGYQAPRCWLKREAADALAKVEAELRARNQRLRIYDCYRPARAVAHFMRWAADPADVRMKATHYPDLDKPDLLKGYVAPVSGHSRGSTVDLTLLQCDAQGADCIELDMGTTYDFFGTIAHTDSPEASEAQRANRHQLGDAMIRHGFHPYAMEWWHFSFRPEPTPRTLYDVPVTAPEDTVRNARIDQLLQRYDGEVPGASLLVLKDGQAVVSRGYGRADLERGVEAGPATAYRLASVSKQFTATAILLLAEDGTLGIDDPVRKWLPSLPRAAGKVTLRHLLSHTSGLLDYEDLMVDPYRGQISDAGVLALLEKEDRLYFPAGSTYRYSNSAYALLALIVERASGASFPEFLEARIFRPVGMEGSRAYVAGGSEVEHRAWGYSQVDGVWRKSDQSSTSAVLGDGGIYSSLEDLAKWDAALYDDRLLNATSRALAFSPQSKVGGEGYDAHYGFGWRITGDTLWHSGETIGFRNVVIRWPKQRLTVVLLTNRNEPQPYRTALEIGAMFLGD